MRLKRILFLLFSAILMTLWPGSVLAGGGGGGGGGPCAGFANGSRLVLRDNCFDGVAHFVQTGTTLVVRNEGELPHSFTAIDGSFDTGILSPGETTRIPLGTAGIVNAYCTLHGTAQGHGMAGILVVGDPKPESGGPTGLGEDMQRSLTEHDEVLRGALSAQARSLLELQHEVGAIKQAIETQARLRGEEGWWDQILTAGIRTDAHLPPVAMLALVGLLTAAVALIVALVRQRSIEP